MKHILVGKLGETHAENFLYASNYQILQKNFHSRFGEIDIIALDLSKNELVFIEVKSRTTYRFGTPQESVNYLKKTKLLKTALQFLNSSRPKSYNSWRIDVIAVKLDEQYRLINLNQFKNIFDG